jgi:hypothetical protein
MNYIVIKSRQRTNNCSFIEENHEFKLARQAQQSKQVSPPGRPSQDMMSYWGSRNIL